MDDSITGPKSKAPWLDALLSVFPFDVEEQLLGAYRSLLRVVIIAHMLPDELPSRPIVLITGDPGAGKTVLARSVGRILTDVTFNVSNIPPTERDLWPVLSSRMIVVFDNVERAPAYFADAAASASTGGSYLARMLYTDAKVIELRPRSFIWITSFSTDGMRSDILDRTLPFILKPSQVRIPESTINTWIETNRQALQEEIGRIADEAKRLLHAESASVVSADLGRMADFVLVSRAIAKALAGDEEVRLVEAALRSTKMMRLRLLSRDPIRRALLDYASRKTDEWLLARQLLQKLAESFGNEDGFRATAMSAEAFGKLLRKIERETAGVVRIETRTLNGMTLYRVSLVC
jgi:MoxR-like ATPase